jgi:hypothetical protein
MSELILNVIEGAGLLGVDPATLQDLSDKKFIPYYVINGERGYRYIDLFAINATRNTDVCWSVNWPNVINGKVANAADILHTLAALLETFSYCMDAVEEPTEREQVHLAAKVRSIKESCNLISNSLGLEV